MEDKGSRIFFLNNSLSHIADIGSVINLSSRKHQNYLLPT
ncbi:hypothetical protein BVRB_5g117400 [Beta vulgaris subsp. vulgaris]|nr:hypothetical protein BVRB_5g117400 [Beta vulgaris subsp. vulgaris]